MTRSDAAPTAAVPRTRGPVASRRRRQAGFRWAVIALTMVFFLVPLVAMLDFSTRTLAGTRTGKAWSTLVDVGKLSTDYQPLWDGLNTSLALVVLTVVIMLVLLVPTMTWVRLRLPGLRRPMEFLCLLPLTIPAIVLVVGLAPIYRTLAGAFSTSAIWLCLAYVVLVLPFAYRGLDAGLDAIDIRTLSEAARNLGANWPTVLWLVVVPNIRVAVAGASFVTVALVLGEFTIASLLSRNNLQTGLLSVSATDPRLAVAIALVALLFAFLLLLALALVDRSQRIVRS